MAKYEITHTCGHTERHNIVGPHAGRAAQMDRLADRMCAACFATKVAAERAAETAAAAEQTADLPNLTGSQKQVAWATTIRAKAITAVEVVMVGHTLSAQQQAVIDALRSQTGAGWWIDHRANDESARAWLSTATSLARETA